MTIAQRRRWNAIFRKYRSMTMVPESRYLACLKLVYDTTRMLASKAVVECGVWRGGMAAGMAEVAVSCSKVLLFDSFEGLPKPTSKDGRQAQEWKADVHSPRYFNNCTASAEECADAIDMLARNRDRVEIVKGDFKRTLALYRNLEIGVLRIDCDWYESVTCVLEAFWPIVAPGGVVIVDDYLDWPGCRIAVHEYLGRHCCGEAIEFTEEGHVMYLRKGSCPCAYPA